VNSGSLIDLDPPPARDRRWPFYVIWMMGGAVVGAVLLSHLPGSIARPAAPVVTEPPAAVPATPQPAPRFRVAPLPPLAPARP
jgi:hypothetical protein